MTTTQSLICELNDESEATRRVLERVPVPAVYGDSADEPAPFA